MRRIDRYLLTEILGPLALGFIVYSFILLIQALFRSAELIIGSDVPASIVGRLLLLSLPSIVVLTIPMSLLFGILIGIGRLSADSELIALRSSGVSMFSLCRPILLLSALLTGLNLYLMLEVLPAGNHALQRLQLEILTKSLTEEVQPRTPHTGWEGRMLYVFESPPEEGRWHGTFLAEAIPTQQSQVIVAEYGQAISDNANDQVLLQLKNAVSHGVDFDKPADYQVLAQQEYSIKLSTVGQKGLSSVRKGLRELRLRELRERIRDPNTDADVRNLARVEIHKRFSFPSACLVFGLLALPLGFTGARAGRSAGFAVSIGVILVYYIIFNSGEEAARDGTVVPWLAVWLPNFLFLALALYLIYQKNRDRSFFSPRLMRWLIDSIASWLPLRRVKKNPTDAGARPSSAKVKDKKLMGKGGTNLVLRLPDMSLSFPSALDRYVLRHFFYVLLMAFLSGISVYLVADLTENVEDILNNHVPLGVVYDYYKYKSFAIAYEIAPIIVLVSTLVTFGLMSRTNEIIACKAVGISLYRMAIPVLLAAALGAFLAFFVQSEVLPASNSKVAELRATIRGKEAVQERQRADRQWLYGKGNVLYNYTFYDTARRELQRLQIFKFDDNYRLIGRLLTERASYNGDGWWIFTDGWARTFDGSEITGFSTFDQPVKYRLAESPEFFQGGLTPPEEMNYVELRDYVRELQSTGQKVPELEVALYNKVAYPLISFVMALVALPFAFRLGRRGALYGVGLSLILGIILVIILGIFKALGQSAILPPLLAVWAPSAIFTIFSLYLFLGVRS